MVHFQNGVTTHGPIFEALQREADHDLVLQLKMAVAARKFQDVVRAMKQMMEEPQSTIRNVYLEALPDILAPQKVSKEDSDSWETDWNGYPLLMYFYFSERLSRVDASREKMHKRYGEIFDQMTVPHSTEAVAYAASIDVAKEMYSDVSNSKDSDSIRSMVLQELIFSSAVVKEGYKFSALSLATSLGKTGEAIRAVLDGLVAGGYVAQEGPDTFKTTLANCFCATAMVQAYAGRLLAKLNGDPEEIVDPLNKLRYILNPKVLDRALELFFASYSDSNARRNIRHVAQSVIHQNSWGLANGAALTPIIQKHYPAIKAYLKTAIQKDKLWAAERDYEMQHILAVLGRGQYMDDELAKHFFDSMVDADEELRIVLLMRRALKECGKLVEGPTALEQRISALLGRDDASVLFSSSVLGDIKELHALIEQFSRAADRNLKYRTQIEAVVMALCDAYFSTKISESRDLLETLLSELSNVAKKQHKHYQSMGGAMYRTITWERFQSSYGFLKILRDRMLEKAAERQRANGLLEPIEGLMREQGDLPPVVRTAVVAARSFSEKYRDAMDVNSALNILREEYPMEGVNLEVKIIPSMLAGVAHGMTDNIGPKHYQLNLVNAFDRHLQYLLFHEYMHVWLVENGLNVSWNIGRDEGVGRYVSNLSNLVNDYIIEKENHRRFGSSYADITQQLRDTDLTGQLKGLGIGVSSLDILMLALTAKVTTQFYPELRDSVSANVIGTGIKWDGLDDLLDILRLLSCRTLPDDYRDAVLSVHRLLTRDDARASAGSVKVDSEKVKIFTRGVENEMAPILSAVRNMDRHGLSVSPTRQELRKQIGAYPGLHSAL